jgi:hypothetical protein
MTSTCLTAHDKKANCCCCCHRLLFQVHTNTDSFWVKLVQKQIQTLQASLTKIVDASWNYKWQIETFTKGFTDREIIGSEILAINLTFTGGQAQIGQTSRDCRGGRRSCPQGSSHGLQLPTGELARPSGSRRSCPRGSSRCCSGADAADRWELVPPRMKAPLARGRGRATNRQQPRCGVCALAVHLAGPRRRRGAEAIAHSSEAGPRRRITRVVVDVHRYGRVLGTSATAEVPGVKEVQSVGAEYGPTLTSRKRRFLSLNDRC